MMMTELHALLLKRLVTKDKEESHKRLVDLYDKDWEQLKELKTRVGVEWKDFFRVVLLMTNTFVDNPAIVKEINKKVGENDDTK